MALVAPTKTNTTSKFKPQEAMEAGTYPARLSRVLDLGVQPQQPYQGQEKAPAHRISTAYEFVDAFMLDEDGNEMEDKPRWISEDFPLNPLASDLAKSTKRYLALDPQQEHGGDWSLLLGQPCMVTIAVNVSKASGKSYNKITNVTVARPRDAAKMPELKNEPLFLDLDNPDLEVFNKLPEWQQNLIKGNLKYAGSPLERALNGEAPVKQPKKTAPVEDEPTDDVGDYDAPW